MTNSLSYRIAAVSLSLLMLLSSTGFSMDAHYCQDKLKGINFFGKAKSCLDKQDFPPCHMTKKTCKNQNDGISQTDNGDCCHNESIVIEKSDADATFSQLAIVQDIQADFVAAFVALYVFDYTVEADSQPYDQYKPPLPDRDVQVLYQTFLI